MSDEYEEIKSGKDDNELGAEFAIDVGKLNLSEEQLRQLEEAIGEALVSQIRTLTGDTTYSLGDNFRRFRRVSQV